MENKKLKLTFRMILDRGHYGYFFYYWLYSLILDFRLAGKLLNDTVFNQSERAFPVQSISYPYIKAFIDCVDFRRDEVFVDVGCAWGRLLGYMRSHTPIKKFIGVELNESVAECAAHIFRDDPDVTIISGDITEKLPLDGTVFYLFNPFDKDTLEKFIEKIEYNIDHSIRLFYLHPVFREVIDGRGPQWKLLDEHKIKPSRLGALTLCIYNFSPQQKYDIR